jgi:peptidoglycan-N-acetylglucosamine deacetylase
MMMTTFSTLFPLWLAIRGVGLPVAPLPETPAPLSRPISRVNTPEPVVAITFDACATKKGWYGFDRDVFDILKREQVPATIFVSGRWVDTHPEAMGDLTSDPLIEFGDHSYDHPHMTQLPAERVGEEIDQTEAALGRYGRRSVAFRPPFGDWNRRVMEIVLGKNLPTVTWDVVSGDPSLKTTTAAMIRAVVGHARSGSIIIFHINGRGWKTHEALPAILSGLHDRGFRFVSLSELMRGGGPPVGPVAKVPAGAVLGTAIEAPRGGPPAPRRAVP